MKKIKITKKGVFRFVRQMIVSLIMLAIFGAIGVYVAYDSNYGKPDKDVDQLFQNFYANNWRTIYELSETEDSDFVNYYTFAYVMNNLLADVDKESVVKGEVKQDGKQVTLDILYGEGGTDKYALTLVEDEIEKKHYFFPVWKLNLEQEIITDVTIKIPFGYTAELDGINLVTCDSTWLGEEQMIEYHIDRIFAGVHTLQCTRIGREEILINIDLSENNTVYTIAEEYIKHDKVLVDNTVATVFGLYKNALADLGVESLKEYFIEEQHENLDSLYDTLYGKINKSNGAMLVTLEIDEYHLKNGVVSDEKIEIIVDFDCSYTAKKARTTTSGVRQEYSGSTSSTVKLVYQIIDDTYKISDIEFECIDYSKEN